MKPTLFCITFCLIYAYSFGQKENYNWYFGNRVGLTFHTTPPSVLLDGNMNSYAGCASVSDSAGNLLFYTDGQIIYDKSHGVMQNGLGLKSFNTSITSSQTVVIIKKPGSNYLYYVFTVGDFTPAQSHLSFSVVDIRQNGGYGSVISKNTPLLQGLVATRMVIVKDALGAGSG